MVRSELLLSTVSIFSLFQIQSSLALIIGFFTAFHFVMKVVSDWDEFKKKYARLSGLDKKIILGGIVTTVLLVFLLIIYLR